MGTRCFAGGSFHGPHLQLNGPTLLTPVANALATVNSHDQRDAESEVLWLCSEYITLRVINLACADCGSHSHTDLVILSGHQLPILSCVLIQ